MTADLMEGRLYGYFTYLALANRSVEISFRRPFLGNSNGGGFLIERASFYREITRSVDATTKMVHTVVVNSQDHCYLRGMRASVPSKEQTRQCIYVSSIECNTKLFRC